MDFRDVNISQQGRIVVAVVIVLLSVPAWGWAQATNAWTPPRTPDGQPDIQGVWNNYDSGTPFETYDERDAERLAPLARWFPSWCRRPDQRPRQPRMPERDRVIGVHSLILNRQNIDEPERRNERRRSMVVDPPDGRIRIRPEPAAVRNERLTNLTDSYLNHTPWERCITRGVPSSIFPGSYNAGFRIVQAPGYVAIQYEMIHEARIIPIDGRPHAPDGVRLWVGDSRGRWEGNTLVVEVTNYNTKGVVANQGGRARGLPRTKNFRVVERFTVVDPTTINYEATFEDPGTFETPWTIAMPLNRDSTYELFEYACHEGNYGLENSLRSGRAEDRAAAADR